MKPAPLNEGLFGGLAGKILSPAWYRWFTDLVLASGVFSVTATSPVASSGGANPNISMPAANNSVSGYLTAVDHAYLPTANEKAALVGTGTPSGSNKYATADHNHIAGAGAAITEAAITLANNTTNDVSITKHGFAPIAPNDTAKFLRGDGSWASVPITNVPTALIYLGM